LGIEGDNKPSTPELKLPTAYGSRSNSDHGNSKVKEALLRLVVGPKIDKEVLARRE